jgi:holo-[acyl-carrier protein] synthase
VVIIGIGSDLVAISRIALAIDRFDERLLQRMLSSGERLNLPSSPRRAAWLAKRFAAKEACVKALGSGFRHGITLRQIEIVSDSLGKPSLILHEEALARACQLGVRRYHLSLSDDAGMALAFVVLEGSQTDLPH